MRPVSCNSEHPGRFLQQQQQLSAKLGIVHPSESPQLDSATAHQPCTAGAMQWRASSAHQYKAPAANRPRDSKSQNLLKLLEPPGQNRGHSNQTPDTAERNQRSSRSQTTLDPARHPHNSDRKANSRNIAGEDNGSTQLARATAHHLSHRPSRQTEFKSSYLPTAGAENDNGQQRAQQQGYVWPEKPETTKVYASASASQHSPREEYYGQDVEHFPAQGRTQPTKPPSKEAASSSRSGNAQSTAQLFISAKSNRYIFREGSRLSRFSQRGPVASAASHNAAHRMVVLAEPALEELATEAELRSDSDSQQAARVLAAEDFMEDFSAEPEDESALSNGSEGLSAEAQRVEELKARLMEEVMPDVHVVDSIEEARRVSQLLLNDYRHLEFACDTEVCKLSKFAIISFHDKYYCDATDL